MRVAMGEDEQQSRFNPGLLSDVCEAVIAALYLDGGLPAAKEFIEAAWATRIYEDREQIGRASCRERVGQYVYTQEHAVCLEKNKRYQPCKEENEYLKNPSDKIK